MFSMSSGDKTLFCIFEINDDGYSDDCCWDSNSVIVSNDSIIAGAQMNGGHPFVWVGTRGWCHSHGESNAEPWSKKETMTLEILFNHIESIVDEAIEKQSRE